jgi:hypothetical protein
MKISTNQPHARLAVRKFAQGTLHFHPETRLCTHARFHARTHAAPPPSIRTCSHRSQVPLNKHTSISTAPHTQPKSPPLSRKSPRPSMHSFRPPAFLLASLTPKRRRTRRTVVDEETY